MGGVCLNVGCIPTKALLHTADLFEEIHGSAKFGIKVGEPTIDWDATIKNKDGVVKQMTAGVSFLMKKNKIDVVNGAGMLGDRGSVVVTAADGAKRVITAKNTILATGARPREIPAIGAVFDGEYILSSWQALSMKQIPASLLVVGAGAIGVEFASMFRTFGSKVTLIEALPRIVPNEDEEISAELTKSLEKRGIVIHTGAKLNTISKTGSGVKAVITDSNGKEIIVEAERAVVGVGIVANTGSLGIEQRGVALDQRGFITVDAHMRTNVEGVYAIGDCAETEGLVLPYVMPIMQAARALAPVLLGQAATLQYPAMPVMVKTPAYPIVVSPPAKGAEGHWNNSKVEGGMVCRFESGDGQLLGFALLGSATSERAALVKLLPPVLA
jgi:dihydrolipoamide dehydrogenase